ERREVAPATRVDEHARVEQRPHHVGAPEQRELAEDPAVVVRARVAERRRRRLGQLGRLAAGDGQYSGVDGIEFGGGAAGGEQFVGGEVYAAGGERERPAPDVPA